MVFGRLVSEDETVALVVAGMEGDVFTQELYRRSLTLPDLLRAIPNLFMLQGDPLWKGPWHCLGLLT
jgi:hypothetical protein